LVKKYWKVVANAVFLITVFILTFCLIFKDQEMSKVKESIHEVKASYLILGIILALMFIFCESVIIHYLMRTVKQKITFLRCIIYSFVGFFFSAVTPSSSGGQPVQVMWMKRDKISVAVSSLVLMIVTAAFKAVLMIMCIIAVIFEWRYLTVNASHIWVLIVFGFISNLVFVAFLVASVFSQSWLTRMIGKSIFWLGKHHIIKDRQRWLRRIWKVLSKYDKSADYIKQNKTVLVHVFLITILQRLCMFAVTYVVYRSFGLKGISAFEIIALQTMIALAVDSLPLPGAVGASESSFLVIFLTVFGEKFVLPGMLLSRGITYYAMLIISAVITLVSHIIGGQEKNLESGGL
jgi:uncharacterized protein (TIRG00374 family)